MNLYDFQKAFQDVALTEKQKLEPLTKYMSKVVLGNVDHSSSENLFVTSGQIVQVWSYERTKPIQKL